MTYVDGKLYGGQLKNWQRNGRGSLRLKNGKIQKGMWLKDIY